MNSTTLVAALVLGVALSLGCASWYLTGGIPDPPDWVASNRSNSDAMLRVVLRADPRVIVSPLGSSRSVALDLPLQRAAERIAKQAALFHTLPLGDDPDRLHATSAEFEVLELLPGNYSIEWGKRFSVSFAVNPAMSIERLQQAEIELKPGHDYRLGADREPGPDEQLFFWIEDVTLRQIVAGNPLAPQFLIEEKSSAKRSRTYPGPERDRMLIARLFVGDADWVAVDGALEPASLGSADLIVELTMTVVPVFDRSALRTTLRVLCILASAATLGVVPLWQRHEVVLSAELRRPGISESRTYEAQGYVSEWLQTPFTVILPLGHLIFSADRALLGAMESLARIALDQMRRDRVFGAAAD